ncbi:MAG TPA: hypothetical protein DDZ89_10050 [Clostridiales bacterium]|nr:hypothetical protein [Clostridiales bacterium]
MSFSKHRTKYILFSTLIALCEKGILIIAFYSSLIINKADIKAKFMAMVCGCHHLVYVVIFYLARKS